MENYINAKISSDTVLTELWNVMVDELPLTSISVRLVIALS